jgi:hypothetical protein
MRDSQPPAVTCDGWPFLIGPGHTLGVRVVVAPDPLYVSDTYGALLGVAKHLGNPTSFGHVYVQKVTVPDGHPIFTVVYQTIVATDYYIGSQSDRPLADRGGRPIHLTEGLVLRPEVEYASVTGSVLYEAHLAVVSEYALYWQKSSPTFIATSSSLRWEKAEVNPAVQFHVLEPVALDLRRIIKWPDSTLAPSPAPQPAVVAQSAANQTAQVPSREYSDAPPPTNVNDSQVQPDTRDARQDQENVGWFMRMLRALFGTH